jgi:hypothetical protein
MQTTIPKSEIPANRTWRGYTLSPVQEVLAFHAQGGVAYPAFLRLLANLNRAGIAYVVVGSLATAVHGHGGVAPTIELCVRRGNLDRFRRRFVGHEYQIVEGLSRRFYDPQTQITIDLLVSGELAGHTGKNKEIRFPDPAEALDVHGVRTISLERLVALKLVTWRYKDWGDVVELIRRNRLNETFAERLPETVRSAYLQCYDQAVEDVRNEREHGGH